jgi:septal ring factor EnvC (AmiA/AmiB activator)
MSTHVASNKRLSGAAEAVVPFAPSAKTQSSVGADQLDETGQNTLALLHRAADMSDQDYNHVVDIAHKLSDQLEDAKDRISDLEANLKHYQDRTERAEKWLAQIAAEIEQRFFGKVDNRPQQAPSAGLRKP